MNDNKNNAEDLNKNPENSAVNPQYGTKVSSDTEWTLDGKTYRGGNPGEVLDNLRQAEAVQRKEEEKKAKLFLEEHQKRQNEKQEKINVFPTQMPQNLTENMSVPNGRRYPPRSGNPDMSGETSASYAGNDQQYANQPPNMNYGGQMPNSNYPAPVPPPMRYSPMLPSRVGPIVLMILGLIIPIFLAPILTMVGIAYTLFSGSEGKTTIVYEEQQIETEVKADTLTFVSVSHHNLSKVPKCVATLNGKEQPEYFGDKDTDTPSTENTYIYYPSTSGKLVFKCDLVEGKAPSTIGVMPNISMSSIFGWIIFGTVLGIAGVVMFIGAIIWLVKRNRKRKLILSGYQV